MIAEFVTKSLVLVLGYAYPAFQCFKCVEKNVVELHELIFWCQYWIIVAAITVLESIGDVFISWLPMYGEMKLALFIYLWYPKTMGTGYVYDTLLRPYVAKHETHIDRSLVEFRDRAWNLAIYYWQNCTELGSTKILQFLQFVASQSARDTQPSSQSVENQQPLGVTPPSTPSPDNRRPPGGQSNMHRNETPKSESIKVHLQNQKHFIRPEDVLVHDASKSKDLNQKSGLERDLHAARLRVRRFIDGGN